MGSDSGICAVCDAMRIGFFRVVVEDSGELYLEGFGIKPSLVMGYVWREHTCESARRFR